MKDAFDIVLPKVGIIVMVRYIYVNMYVHTALPYLPNKHACSYKRTPSTIYGFFTLYECQSNGSILFRPPDKSEYWKTIFFISHPKHMLWVLKRTVSMRRFF